jgi:hypothetical protein
MAQKPMQRAGVYARALRANKNVKKAEVWVGKQCALRVGGAWESAGVEDFVWGGVISEVGRLSLCGIYVNYISWAIDGLELWLFKNFSPNVIMNAKKKKISFDLFMTHTKPQLLTL